MDNLRKILSDKGFTFSKAFGQNFISDEELLKRIVIGAGVKNTDTVLEIGCGAGTLTRALSNAAKRVVGYEIDKRLKPVLDDTLSGADNVRIVYKDIMKESMETLDVELGKDYILVANLPYYITTPIVMRFLEESINVKEMVVMVQKEVADRLCAFPSSGDYGAITVGINLRGSAKILENVPREKFTPAPNVDSAVVRIDIEKGKFDCDLKKVRETVKAGFNNRRKMLTNNLMRFYGLSRTEVENALLSCGISLTARGEELSAEEFVALSQKIGEVK